MLDLMPGSGPAKDDGKESQSGCQSRHEDGRQALLRAPEHQLEVGVKDQEDSREEDSGEGQNPPTGLSLLLPLSESLGVVPRGELQFSHLGLDIPGHRPQIPVRYVQREVGLSGGSLPVGLVWMVAEEGADLARTLREAVRTQYDAGQVFALELNLANMEGGRAEALAHTTRNDLAEKERQLASREAIPNLDFGSVIDRNAQDAKTTYGLRLSLPIPIWNRNQGRQEEARATEELRSIQLTELELRVRGEVLLAVESYRTTTAELESLIANVLEPARENRALLQRAYEAGQIDLPTTLILQTQQIGAELSYWESWLRQRIALAELEAAVGEIPRTPSSTRVL
jgi:hypothetical protein